MNDLGPSHGLTEESLLRQFPVALQSDPSSAALGEVTARLLARRPEEIGCLSLYPRIDELPEDLLDILAYDFKVDWWDAEYSLEEKRRIFKDSWYVHKHLGTKAAVETALRFQAQHRPHWGSQRRGPALAGDGTGQLLQEPALPCG